MNPEPRKIPEPEADYGEVIELKDDLAIIQMQTSDSCHSCRARVICQPNSAGQRILYVKNTLGAKIGDKVNLEQSGVNQIKLIFMQYGVPLLSFLIVIIVANRFITEKSNGIPPEVIQLIVALVFMILSGVVTYLWSKRKAKQNFSIFRMKSIERE